MSDIHNQTMRFKGMENEEKSIHTILAEVNQALKEKNYNPIDQIVGYILSGDPAYITSHKGARNLIRTVNRDEVLEELVRFYLKQKPLDSPEDNEKV
ncbi:MAG: IreB family regulatory phosphoprotein [Negativicutes bacterium]|nr:IreB family regulatory phosphoprotein [Negativicutes bacterium]